MKWIVLVTVVLTSLTSGCGKGPETENVKEFIEKNQSVSEKQTPGNQSVEESKGQIREAIIRVLENSTVQKENMSE